MFRQDHWMKLRPLPPLRWAMLGCPGRRLANCRKYQMSWWNWWQAAPGNRDSLAEYAQNQKDQHFDAGKHCRGLQRRCHHIMNKHHIYIYIYIMYIYMIIYVQYMYTLRAFGLHQLWPSLWTRRICRDMRGPQRISLLWVSAKKYVYCIHMTTTTSHITPFCWRNTLFVPWEPNVVGGLLNLF